MRALKDHAENDGCSNAGQIAEQIQEAAHRADEIARNDVRKYHPAEIRDVEELLDEYAGAVWTMSNTAHYPTMLVNEPPTTDLRVILCQCGHRQFCNICERNGDELNDRLVRRPALGYFDPRLHPVDPGYRPSRRRTRICFKSRLNRLVRRRERLSRRRRRRSTGFYGVFERPRATI